MVESSASNVGESSYRSPIKNDVTSESCHMIRLIKTQLLRLLDEGVVKYVSGDVNSVQGFLVL